MYLFCGSEHLKYIYLFINSHRRPTQLTTGPSMADSCTIFNVTQQFTSLLPRAKTLVNYEIKSIRKYKTVYQRRFQTFYSTLMTTFVWSPFYHLKKLLTQMFISLRYFEYSSDTSCISLIDMNMGMSLSIPYVVASTSLGCLPTTSKLKK